MHPKPFKDLDTRALIGTRVVLDVDGTLLADGATEMDEETAKALSLLSAGAQVYLCSNATRGERLESLARTHGIGVLLTTHKKPNPRVLEGLPEGGTIVVVGDKYLTDGLLAKRTGSQFILVSRIRGKESLFVRLTYLLDVVIGKAVYSFL